MILLSNYKEWTLSSQLAVTDGIVLNVDAKNLADGSWTGVTKHGDVSFDSTKNSLYFDGDGDYLELPNAGNFNHGFVFEMYCNFERLRYVNGLGINDRAMWGFLCKMPDLNGDYRKALRIAWIAPEYPKLCQFSFLNGRSYSTNRVLYNQDHGISIDDLGYSTNEDVYVTYVYRRYADLTDSEKSTFTEEADRFEYYINGELIGYCYNNPANYDEGLNTWGNSSCPFFIGVCPCWGDGNLFYIKGSCYSVRLYEGSLDEATGKYKLMSKDDVKNNYDTNLQFRNSGL